jgi:hypothetical protein
VAAVGFLPVLLLHLGSSLMNGWMWRPAEAEAINRQAPRIKGGHEPARKQAGLAGLGRLAQAHFGLVRPHLASRCFSVNCRLAPLCMWALDVVFSMV